jgi:serine protease Do
VLTIGYLILEAEQVQLRTDDGRIVPARVVAYDLATGFGLVRRWCRCGCRRPLGEPPRWAATRTDDHQRRREAGASARRG